MAISQEFKEAVEEKKLIRVRIMLKDSLLVDPTLMQFEELENYAASNLSDLYVEHDGEALHDDAGAWTQDYLNQQMVTAVSNFSKERIGLLKRMVRHIYSDRADRIRDEREKTPSSSDISRKQVGVGVTAAGVVLGVAGVCTSHGVLVVGGVLVAAAGVALILSDKGSGE